MTTSSASTLETVKNIPNIILSSYEEGFKQAARLLWSILMSFLSDHWLYVLGILFVFFIVVTLKAMIGEWGALGSFLYNLFYFGTLFVIGLFWGPEVFVDDFFKAACAVILYPICFKLVGIMLRVTRVRYLRS